VDGPEPPADTGGSEPAGKAGPLPGKPLIGGQAAGEPELGEGGQDEPGPAVGGGRIAEFRAGPAQGLLEEPERVPEVKAAQERLPAQVRRGGARVRLRAGGVRGEPQFRAVPRRPAHLAGLAGRRRQAEHPAGAEPPGDLHRKIAQQPGETGRLVPASKITMMSGSPSGRSRTASSGRVQDVRPRSSAATREYGQPGIIWALLFPRP
jgi:hypothetical protein